jgi:hypothetical protein
MPLYKVKKVRSSNGELQERPSIKVSVEFFGKRYETVVSLTNRADMKYPMLIGRHFLSGKFLVDVSQEYLANNKKGEWMNVYILPRNKELYSTKRLVEAAVAKGWEVRVIDYLKCSIEIMKGELHINYLGEQLPVPDAIIPRIGASRTFYGTAMVRHFEWWNTIDLENIGRNSRSRRCFGRY